ncbi:hypothetical protein [Flavobacterium ustbae]|uniref:hypothetical protein n=1 Tax=Flavobacterium ustbae TaxID=2488790 RepID=UPI000F7AB011|nr:hypothetical protein [Flavobacterium ustbae]
MKNLKAPFLVIALLLLNVSFATTKHNLPEPDAQVSSDGTDAGLDDDGPCEGCAPNFPIDENIVFLLGAGLVLGATIVYKNKIKKASI